MLTLRSKAPPVRYMATQTTTGSVGNKLRSSMATPGSLLQPTGLAVFLRFWLLLLLDDSNGGSVWCRIVVVDASVVAVVVVVVAVALFVLSIRP